MEFITKYKGQRKVQLICKEPTLADGSQLKSTDINVIMQKYAKTGVITHITNAIPQFGDVSQLGDYQSCLEHVRHAEQLFSELPARVREKFQNDPIQFVSFMDDEKNLEEAIKLGLAIPKPEPINTAPTNNDSNDKPKP